MEVDIEKIKRRMLIKYPFFGSIVANVEYKACTFIKTAATDGEVVYYNSDFLKRLDFKDQLFVMAHEIGHIAFNHIKRSEEKDEKIWNRATDAVLNKYLEGDGLPIIEGAINMPDAINCDAEELYDKLLKEKEQKEQNKPQDQNPENKQKSNDPQNQNDSQKQTNDDNSKNNVGHDNHSLWKNALNKYKNKEKDEGKDKNNGEIKKTQDKCESLGEKKVFKENSKKREKILEEVEKEITSHLGGNSSNGDIRKIGDIGSANTNLDWRTLLDEAIKYDYDWSYKNATIEHGVVIPHFEKIPFSETEIVVDTSGSVNEELLKNFLRECKSILEFSKIKVGCFDTMFYGFNDIYSDDDIDNLRFWGGGGTNFNAAVNAFSDSADNKIIFTDGYANMPDKEVDAIWIVYGIDKIKPKGGRVIYINAKELKNLKINSRMVRIRKK